MKKKKTSNDNFMCLDDVHFIYSQESEIHEVNTTLLANHDYNNSSDED